MTFSGSLLLFCVSSGNSIFFIGVVFMKYNEKPAPSAVMIDERNFSNLKIEYEKEINEILGLGNCLSSNLEAFLQFSRLRLHESALRRTESFIVFYAKHRDDVLSLVIIKNNIDCMIDQDDTLWIQSGLAELYSDFFNSTNCFGGILNYVNFGYINISDIDFAKKLSEVQKFKIGIANYVLNKDRFAQIKEKYEQWKSDNKNMARYISSISGENLLKPPKEYELLLKKVELQLEKVPKILEQQKQLEFDSDLYKLADEILSGGIRDADYETYKNKVEEFEQKFEEFNKNQDLKNDDNKLDDEKELHEDEIGNDNDGGTLENENVSEEKSDDSNSECSNGGACNCLKNILWYRVFLYLSLFSLLLLIISVYCLIVTAIFLLASVVLYFIQKTKKDNDNMEVMADNLLSSEINQEQSKNLISIDKDHSNNVKQQNEFSLFGRANDGIN